MRMSPSSGLDPGPASAKQAPAQGRGDESGGAWASRTPHVLRHPNHRWRARRLRSRVAARRGGRRVRLSEMRGGGDMTPAHETDRLAEMVCSNSFRSDDAENNAVGLLHQEMRALGSLIMRCGGPASRARRLGPRRRSGSVRRRSHASDRHASQHHDRARTRGCAARPSGDHRHRAADRLGAGRGHRHGNRRRTRSPSSTPSPRSSTATASTWTSPGWRRGGTRAARITSTARWTRRSTRTSSPR